MTADRIWPDGLEAYKRTSEFTEASVPAALLQRHSTKAGVWARLHVVEGALIFRDLETGRQNRLAAGVHPLIHPQQDHEVEPIGKVRFFVEFCRLRAP